MQPSYNDIKIPSHCLRAKSNKKTRGQFECGVSWFSFYFDFVHMHAVVVVPWFVGEDGGGGCLKLAGHDQEGEKSVHVDGQGVGDLEN